MCARYKFVECIKWTFSARLLFRFFCNLYFVDTQSFRSVRATEYKLYFFHHANIQRTYSFFKLCFFMIAVRVPTSVPIPRYLF